MADLDAEKAEAELRALLALAVDQRDRAAELDARMRLGALQVATGDAAAALEIVAAGRRCSTRASATRSRLNRLWYVAGQARARAGGDALAAFEGSAAVSSGRDQVTTRCARSCGRSETLQAQRRIRGGGGREG
ncbi:MAG: hypothetical protein H6701_13945 [Myxococcales bacterium]|nr:hypothetical protein [Myxococcales bacterium]